MYNIRTRAWRRAQRARHRSRKLNINWTIYLYEKNWKFVYTRGYKLHRALQVGMIWPHREWQPLMEHDVDED